MREYMVSEARGNAVYENNCIYIPENYPEAWKLARLSVMKRTESSVKFGMRWDEVNK